MTDDRSLLIAFRDSIANEIQEVSRIVANRKRSGHWDAWSPGCAYEEGVIQGRRHFLRRVDALIELLEYEDA